MKKCFHFTRHKHLKDIFNNGLQPQYGLNCLLIDDKKGKKVSYSVEIDGAIDFFAGLYETYYFLFHSKSKSDDIIFETMVKDIKSKSFEEWQENGVYLMFDGDVLKQKNETEPFDAYTTESISPEMLKICVIKEKSTGKIFSYSKYDIIDYFISQNSDNYPFFYMLMRGNKVKQFAGGNYFIEYMDFKDFYSHYKFEIHTNEYISKLYEKDLKEKINIISDIELSKLKKYNSNGDIFKIVNSEVICPILNQLLYDENFDNKIEKIKNDYIINSPINEIERKKINNYIDNVDDFDYDNLDEGINQITSKKR